MAITLRYAVIGKLPGYNNFPQTENVHTFYSIYRKIQPQDDIPT